MTITLQGSTKTLPFLVATAALSVSVSSNAATLNERGDIEVNPPATMIAQADQTLAEKPAAEKTELSIEQAIAKVKEQGYSDISEIEREKNGRFCVEARDPTGKEVEIYVDAKTGEVIKKDKGDKADLSKDEVIAKLKEQGYPEVSKIERERDQYWVIATDADGKKFELHVNAKTGEITRKEQKGR
jgi:uncharacterized membrane protein YkoI